MIGRLEELGIEDEVISEKDRENEDLEHADRLDRGRLGLVLIFMEAVSCELLEARQYLLICDLNVNQAVEVLRSAIPSVNHPRRHMLTRLSMRSVARARGPHPKSIPCGATI